MMVVVALLTAINITRNVEKQFTMAFSINALTLAALALIWLPTLLNILGLVGGSFKAGGFEANLHGILTPAEAIDISVDTRQVLSAGDDEARMVAAYNLEQTIARLANPTLEQQTTLPDAALMQLARSYERLRRDLDPGSQRTSAMTRIVNEARVRASSAPSAASARALTLLRSASPGDRIVGLALMQETGAPEGFEAVLNCVTGSLSAFEMYSALLALQEMSQSLTADQREQARRTLESEYQDPRGVGVTQDAGLPNLFKRTLAILEGKE